MAAGVWLGETMTSGKVVVKVMPVSQHMLKSLIRILFGLLLAAIGVLHFVRPAPFVAIVPPWLPWPLALVYVSGAAEIAFGVLLLFRRTRVLAAWGIILLLIAVFPANIHMAVNAHLFPAMSEPVLWARLPLQLVLIALAYRFTRGDPAH